MNVLSSHLAPFIAYATARGLNAGGIFAPGGHTAQDAYMPQGRFLGALAKFKSSFGEEALLGIQVGNFCQLGALGLVYQISLRCATLREALYYLQDYMAHTLPVVAMDINIAPAGVNITVRMPDDQLGLGPMVLSCYLTIIAREVKLMCAHQVDVVKASPHYTQAYPNDFSYGSDYALIFPMATPKAALKSFKTHHFDYLIPQYLRLVASGQHATGFSGRVKSTVLQMASPELPGLSQVAKVLCLSPRTLQRALAKEGYTYREIRNGLNKQIALLLMRHEPYRVKDISDLLGYAETAAFARAFYKWYGQTPSHYLANVVGHGQCRTG